jgi:DNA/RNA-binding domain of Phe-tRNA-synthetase-like protein
MDFELTPTLSRDVEDRYPEFGAAFLAVAAKPYSHQHEADEAADALVTRVLRAHPSPEGLRGSPADECYRDFYRSMGLKAAQVSTPVKQAMRVLKTGYRSISRIVDVAMEIEYATLVSFQVYDADVVGPNLTYTLACGTESIATTRGEMKTCKPGELILAAGDRVVHSVYYGNDPKYMATTQTTIALVRVMKVPGMDEAIFRSAVEEASSRLGAVRDFHVRAGSRLEGFAGA